VKTVDCDHFVHPILEARKKLQKEQLQQGREVADAG
jgi:hypothetical protein